MLEKETKLGLGTISDNSAPDYWLDYFTQLINNWVNYVNHIIQKVSKEAAYDDGNLSGFPVEVYSFVDGQQDYGLDSDIATVRKIEKHKAGSAANVDWSDVDFQPLKDRSSDRFNCERRSG